jgi:tetratricopeptide (TPR) repeat protein
MSIEPVLDFIRERFSPVEGQLLLHSLQQDPLVWQFIREEESTLAFQVAETGAKDFSPGKLAAWLIQEKTGVPIDEFITSESPLPEELRTMATKALESTLNTGLPPPNLLTAGLIAIALREHRLRQGNWKAISSEILIKRNQQAVEKNFHIWRTPIACLFTYCTDFDDFLSEFTKTQTGASGVIIVPILIHTLLAHPIEPANLLDQLFSFAQNLPIEMQLETLKWLEIFNRKEMGEKLAKNLVQTKKNMDYFSKIFSELEEIGGSDTSDPLEKRIRYTLPEDVNKVAAFYHYSNRDEKASATYTKSNELLNILESQSSYQTLTSQGHKAPYGKWVDLIKAIPNSKRARTFLIKSLIQKGDIKEARKQLENFPESDEKQLLQIMIEANVSHSEPISLPGQQKNSKLQPETALLHLNNTLASYANSDFTEELLNAVKKHVVPNQKLTWLEPIVETNYNNPRILTVCRDIFEKSNNTSRAIELTSYLERFQPGKVTHKRDLARLLSISERWHDAFSILQDLIKSESTYDIKDLERFAESALRTDRIESALSICQNILKQEPQNSKALVLLGEGFMMKGDSVKAIQHMEQVVDLLPDEPDTWLTLAKLWEKSGQIDRAFEILSKGNLAVPNEPKLLRAIGIAHLLRQAPADAMTHLKRANELDPINREGVYYLATSYYRLGQFEQAWRLLEPSVDLDGANPDDAKLTGQVLLALNEKEKAEPILIKAAELRPEDLETVLLATELVLERAEKYADQQIEPDLDRLENLLDKSHQIFPTHQQIRLHLADIDRLNGFHDKALEAYQALSKESQDEKSIHQSWRLPFGLGQTAIELGEIEIGLAALQDAATKQPENLLVLHALAAACLKANLDAKAHETAKFALKLAPQEIDNILWYADFKTKSNDPKEAVKALNEALQITPHRSELKLWLAKTYLLMDLSDDAKRTLVELLSDPNSNAKDLHQAAYLFIQLNEIDLAAQALEKTINAAENFNPTAVMDLAVVYTQLENRKKALDLLNVDTSIQIQYPQLVLLKSDVLCNLGQYSHAINSLNLIKEHVEHGFENISNEKDESFQSPLLYHFDLSKEGYFYRIGQLNRAIGKFSEAQTFLMQASLLEPSNTKYLKALCDAYYVGLDFDHALNSCENQSQLRNDNQNSDPDQFELLCNKAEIALIRGDIESTRSIEKTFKGNLNFLNARCFAVLAQISAHQNKSEEARSFLTKAEQVYQESLSNHTTHTLEALFREVMTLNSLAEAFARSGDKRKALDYNQNALDKLDNQPLINWRYVLNITEAAENQQIAEEISLVTHAPGKDILSDKYHSKAQDKAEGLADYLTQKDFMCLKARITSAFTGKWPLSLSADACLANPEEAAAVILGTDDNDYAQKIADSYLDHPRVLQAYGVFALRNKRKDGLAYIEKALQMDISNPIFHALFAKLSTNDLESALNSIETALSFWPDEPGWHAMASDYLTRMGNLEKASQHISYAIEYEPEDALLWEKRAEIRLQNNDLVHAKSDLEKSATYQSENPGIWVKMSNINRRLGEVNEAIHNMRTASTLAPRDLTIAAKEIKLLIDQKQYREAEIKAADILTNKRNDETALILLAKAQAEQGKFDQAMESVTKATENHPDKPDLILEKIKIKKSRDGMEAALTDLINLAHNNPDNPEVLTSLTDWLIQANRLEEAQEAAQTILRIIPDSAEVHLMLGRLQRIKGQLDQAIAHLSDAVNYDPGFVEAYLELGKAYQDRRDLDEAIKIFQKGALADGSDHRPYYYAGMALKEIKDYANAELMLRQAKKLAPDDPQIIRQLGVITALNLINNLREVK